ncbi:MAG: ectoine hydroxylase-related dioxygenase (phytanoyl-CoA dioxygenase family) [Candidatus Latescibacterota bacterium]|jgi:ectoine hydroxylase-related dioxygenase (phytanoyl-CoA dioxygenase family)
MQIEQKHIDQFVNDGLTLIDNVCTEQEMVAASAGFDHLYTHGEKTNGITQYFDEPGLIDVLQHPNLEAAAKVMLGADDVVLNSSACLFKQPEDVTEWETQSEHVDIQFSIDEMESTPRRMLAMMMVIVDDLPEGRGNTFVRLGSHRVIAEWLREHGEEPVKAQPTRFEDLPRELTFTELTPVVARRGQAAAFSTAVVHCGSTNIDTQSRKIMFVNFCPLGMMKQTSGNHNLSEVRSAWREKLKGAFRADRQHLLLDNE